MKIIETESDAAIMRRAQEVERLFPSAWPYIVGLIEMIRLKETSKVKDQEHQNGNSFTGN